MVFLFYQHPRFALKSLQIGMMFKQWKSKEGQNGSKLAMSGHLTCFFPVNHLLLSCPLSAKKPQTNHQKSPKPKSNQHSFFCGMTTKKPPNWSQSIFKGGKRKKEHTRTEGYVDFWIYTFKIHSHSKHTSSVPLTAKTLSLVIKETDEVQMAACVLSWLLHKL